jgi:protein phosphatase
VRTTLDMGLLRAPVTERVELRPEVYGCTDRGRVRPNNEDQFLIADLERRFVLHESSAPAAVEALPVGDRRQGFLFVVADGMGGYEGGEIASAVAVGAIAKYALELMPWLVSASDSAEHELADGMRAAMQVCHDRVREAARERALDLRMGTTLTLAYAVWPRLYVLHAGDSRAYMYRAGGLYRLTRDHTLSQRLVEQNVLTEDQAAKSRYSHILLNAVGGQSESVQVELHQLDLRKRDLLLLCTDGLTGELHDDLLAARLGRGGPVRRMADDLVLEANRAGGHDNVTLIVARF